MAPIHKKIVQEEVLNTQTPLGMSLDLRVSVDTPIKIEDR